jgi:hypothetical protein
METDTHTPEEGDRMPHGETEGSADELAKRSAWEEIGSGGVDKDTTAKLRKILHPDEPLPPELTEVVDDSAVEDDPDLEPEPEPEPARKARPAATQVAAPDPDEDWRLSQAEIQRGLSGVERARRIAAGEEVADDVDEDDEA